MEIKTAASFQNFLVQRPYRTSHPGGKYSQPNQKKHMLFEDLRYIKFNNQDPVNIYGAIFIIFSTVLTSGNSKTNCCSVTGINKGEYNKSLKFTSQHRWLSLNSF